MALLPHNTGLKSDRLDHPDSAREVGFAEEWNKHNEEEGPDQSFLQKLFIGPKDRANYFEGTDKDYDTDIDSDWVKVYDISEREHRIVATVIQWLGTNCGFAFLRESLRRSGHTIIEERLLRELNQSCWDLQRTRKYLPLLIGISPEIDKDVDLVMRNAK